MAAVLAADCDLRPTIASQRCRSERRATFADPVAAPATASGHQLEQAIPEEPTVAGTPLASRLAELQQKQELRESRADGPMRDALAVFIAHYVRRAVKVVCRLSAPRARRGTGRVVHPFRYPAVLHPRRVRQCRGGRAGSCMSVLIPGPVVCQRHRGYSCSRTTSLCRLGTVPTASASWQSAPSTGGRLYAKTRRRLHRRSRSGEVVISGDFGSSSLALEAVNGLPAPGCVHFHCDITQFA